MQLASKTNDAETLELNLLVQALNTDLVLCRNGLLRSINISLRHHHASLRCSLSLRTLIDQGLEHLTAQLRAAGRCVLFGHCLHTLAQLKGRDWFCTHHGHNGVTQLRCQDCLCQRMLRNRAQAQRQQGYMKTL
jgi:hypothetical protein